MASVLRLSAYTVITILNFGQCHCLAEYEQFPGFDAPITETTAATTTTATSTTTSSATTNATTKFFFYTPKTAALNNSMNSSAEFFVDFGDLNTTQHPSNTSTTACPEEELPTNIGPYEVPTQRDLVKHMKAKLLKVFNKYHEKALYFLKDIREATRATSELELKCPTARRETYRRCVRHVNKQCREITRSLVTSLEYQRHDVIALTEGPICNMSAMRTDPVRLIKLVAMEAVSLEFALPGFLRLLGACSYYCNTSHINTKQFKPTRHLSDQELVVKHLLTRKNYVQLIKTTP